MLPQSKHETVSHHSKQDIVHDKLVHPSKQDTAHDKLVHQMSAETAQDKAIHQMSADRAAAMGIYLLLFKLLLRHCICRLSPAKAAKMNAERSASAGM